MYITLVLYLLSLPIVRKYVFIIVISPNAVYDETRRYLTVLICFAYRAVGRRKASTIFI